MCDICKRLLQENEALTEEVSGLLSQVRGQAKRENALRRELRKQRGEEPQAQVITEVLEHWKKRLGHPRAKIPLDGERAKLVRRALKWGHTKQELCEAIDGLALVPYVGPRGRKPTGQESERYDDVEYALSTEKRVKDCRGYAQRARNAADRDAMWETWQRISALEYQYGRLVMGAAIARDEGIPVDAGIRRVDGIYSEGGGA